MRPAPHFQRTQRAPLSLARRGAVSASVVAALVYPQVASPKRATADPVLPPIPPPAQLASPGGSASARSAALGLQLAAAETTLAQTQAQMDAATSHLRVAAVASFVDGRSAGSGSSALTGSGDYDTVVSKEYLATVTGDVEQTVDQLGRARSALRYEQARLATDERLTEAAITQAAGPQAEAASYVADPSGGSLAINGPSDFAIALLRALNDPMSLQNVQAIIAWCQREGGAWNSPAQFNPLNTSMRMPGSYGINGDGVQSYTSWSQGLTATVATLDGGAYHGILAALSAGTSVSAVEEAVEESPWGTHF